MVEKTHAYDWFPSLYEPFRNVGQKVADWFSPRSEASASEAYYEISVELPGVKSDDIDVSIHDNRLLVRGECKSEREEKGRTYFFSERQYGVFQRSFTLPADADDGNVDAEFSDGVLHLKIAKQKPTEPPRRKIEVRNS